MKSLLKVINDFILRRMPMCILMVQWILMLFLALSMMNICPHLNRQSVWIHHQFSQQWMQVNSKLNMRLVQTRMKRAKFVCLGVV